MSTDQECFDKAKANGEPTFTLRARDPFAAFLVRQWANLADSAGVNFTKVRGALAIANHMQSWSEKKIPD